MMVNPQKVPDMLRKTPVWNRRFYFVVSGGYPDFLPFLAGSHTRKVAVYLCFPFAFILKFEIKCCQKVASHPRKYFSV